RVAIDCTQVHRAARAQNACALGERAVGIQAVLDGSERHHTVERGCLEWEMFGVAAHQRRREPRALQTTTRDDEPPEGDVDANDRQSTSCAREHQVCRTTSNIEPPASPRSTRYDTSKPF